MKTCTKCLEPYDESFFYKKKNNLLRSECKKCFSKMVVKNQTKIKNLMIKYKGGACQICGYDKHHSVLEFHHIDPTKKDYNPSKASSFESVKPELDKCILLCANCHREVHAGITPLPLS